MIAYVVLTLLIGMVLGQRFKVVVLMPTIALVLAVTICVGIARADAPFYVAVLTAAAIAAVQVGYVAGIGIRYLTVIARANRRRAVRATLTPHRHPAH